MSARKIFLLLLAICFAQNLYAQEITDTYFTQTIEQFANQGFIRTEHHQEFVDLAQKIDAEVWTKIDRRDMDRKLENPEWNDNERLIWKGIYVYYYYLLYLNYKSLEIYQTEDIDNTNASVQIKSFFRAICFISHINAYNATRYLKWSSIFAIKVGDLLPNFLQILKTDGLQNVIDFYFPSTDLYSLIAKLNILDITSYNDEKILNKLNYIWRDYPDSFLLNFYKYSLYDDKSNYQIALELRPNNPLTVYHMIGSNYDDIPSLKRLVRELPFVLQAYEKLAHRYLNLGEIAKGQAVLDDALEHISEDTHPRDIQGIYDLQAFIYSYYLEEKDQDYAKAEEYIDKIRELAPDSIATYRILQSLWRNTAWTENRNKRAVQDMNTLMELCKKYDTPIQAEDYWYKALFLMKLKNNQEAYPLLVKAIDAPGLGDTLEKKKLKAIFDEILGEYSPPEGPSKKVKAFLRSVLSSVSSGVRLTR